MKTTANTAETLRTRRGSIAAVLLFALLMAACGGGSSKSNNIPVPPVTPPTGGLDARPSNLSCIAPARGSGGAAVDVAEAFPALPAISQPTKIIVEPVVNPRWFVLQKSGQIIVFDPDNATSTTVFLDISPLRTVSEGGLLGMAFHPNYPAVPEIFLYYTINGVSTEMRSVISRFILDDVNAPGAGTVEQVILEIDQFASNHNGGDIAFGVSPDNSFYIGLGDGGGANDPQETGQNTTRLLGSMLRIDVVGTGAGYDIPGDNPFATNARCGPGNNVDDCPEIYAWGLRNPWRWSFDPPTGVLWLADVGQGSWEEVDQIVLGGNYGWDCREGAHDFETSGCSGPFVEPVSEYSHSSGNNSITGGFVYRGTAIPGLVGRYVFGDYGSGRIWALAADGMGGFSNEELANTATGPSAFGVDQDGELFFADIKNNRIMQLVPGGGGVDPVPDLLSASGCIDQVDITSPYAGLIPYDINAAFWSDGAVKDRYIGLPDGQVISIDAQDDWVFPPGTVLVKNFRLGGRLIETRHLMHHPDGVWAGYTYEWNVAETEATRVRGGKVVLIDGQDWVFPDEAECLQCHTVAAGVALGPETAQLNKDFTYPSTARTHNQLETLDAIAMFSSPLPGDPATLPVLPDPMDATADLSDRARAYLHTNCAQCHQPGGPTPVNVDLRYTTLLANMSACDVAPDAGGLGIVAPLIIAPGDTSRSVLVARVNRRDVDGMPPLGSSIADADGVTLLSDWINSLTQCN